MKLFCAECGSELRLNVNFCTKCGEDLSNQDESAASADLGSINKIIHEHVSVPFFKRYRPQIGAGIAVVGLIIGGSIYLSKSAVETNLCASATGACAKATEANAPVVTGQATSMFVVADANVRDKATAQGSNILRKISRGESVSGVMQIGEDGESLWLKLSDNAGYMGATNLATFAPPKLAKSFTDMLWNVETDIDLLKAPAEGSPVVGGLVGRLDGSNQVTIAGVTTNGYAEVKRARGGVGYFLVSATNDRNGALAVDDSTAPDGAPAEVLATSTVSAPKLTAGNTVATAPLGTIVVGECSFDSGNGVDRRVLLRVELSRNLNDEVVRVGKFVGYGEICSSEKKVVVFRNLPNTRTAVSNPNKSFDTCDNGVVVVFYKKGNKERLPRDEVACTTKI